MNTYACYRIEKKENLYNISLFFIILSTILYSLSFHKYVELNGIFYTINTIIVVLILFINYVRYVIKYPDDVLLPEPYMIKFKYIFFLIPFLCTINIIITVVSLIKIHDNKIILVKRVLVYMYLCIICLGIACLALYLGIFSLIDTMGSLTSIIEEIPKIKNAVPEEKERILDFLLCDKVPNQKNNIITKEAEELFNKYWHTFGFRQKSLKQYLQRKRIKKCPRGTQSGQQYFPIIQSMVQY